MIFSRFADISLVLDRLPSRIRNLALPPLASYHGVDRASSRRFERPPRDLDLARRFVRLAKSLIRFGGVLQLTRIGAAGCSLCLYRVCWWSGLVRRGRNEFAKRRFGSGALPESSTAWRQETEVCAHTLTIEYFARYSLILYSASKLLVYLVLLERLHIVHGNSATGRGGRTRSPLYMIGAALLVVWTGLIFLIVVRAGRSSRSTIPTLTVFFSARATALERGATAPLGRHLRPQPSLVDLVPLTGDGLPRQLVLVGGFHSPSRPRSVFRRKKTRAHFDRGHSGIPLCHSVCHPTPRAPSCDRARLTSSRTQGQRARLDYFARQRADVCMPRSMHA